VPLLSQKAQENRAKLYGDELRAGSCLYVPTTRHAPSSQVALPMIIQSVLPASLSNITRVKTVTERARHRSRTIQVTKTGLDSNSLKVETFQRAARCNQPVTSHASWLGSCSQSRSSALQTATPGPVSLRLRHRLPGSQPRNLATLTAFTGSVASAG